MNVYFTTNFNEAILDVSGTRQEVQAAIQKNTGWDREDLRVELWDVPTDKAAILDLIEMAARPADPYHPRENHGKLLAAWNVTKRGGLKEVKDNEEPQ